MQCRHNPWLLFFSVALYGYLSRIIIKKSLRNKNIFNEGNLTKITLNNDDRNYVEPDIGIICDMGKLNSNGCNGAPDWIIEVVSPGTEASLCGIFQEWIFKYVPALHLLKNLILSG